jgi:hypothetical protein
MRFTDPQALRRRLLAVFPVTILEDLAGGMFNADRATLTETIVARWPAEAVAQQMTWLIERASK